MAEGRCRSSRRRSLAFLLVYIAALVALFVSSFWTVDPFTSQLVHNWTLDNFRTLWDEPTYRNVALRTIGDRRRRDDHRRDHRVPVRVLHGAGRRRRACARVLFVLVLLPLWASYLARVYSWRLILNSDGVLNWSLHKLGLPAANIAYTNTAIWIVFSYVWLPFMILPVYAVARADPPLLHRGLARPRREGLRARCAR